MTNNDALTRAVAIAGAKADTRPLLDALDLAIVELRQRSEQLSVSTRAAGFLEAFLLPPEVDRDVRRLQNVLAAIDQLGALKRALEQGAGNAT